MEISFECKKCRKEFDCEMGKIGINEQTMRPTFEKPIICPRCGKKTIDEVLLTGLLWMMSLPFRARPSTKTLTSRD